MLIPLNERSMHVQRQRDRQTLGLGLANDLALSVSICRTGDFAEAYDRYVWTWAYLCVKFGWNPIGRITAHRFEDPARRSDPQSWLDPNGITGANSCKM
jgi:N-acetylmuramoyl-L-alanine amidase